jgi:hypothetical protein
MGKVTYQKVKGAFEHYKKPKPKSFKKKPRWRLSQNKWTSVEISIMRGKNEKHKMAFAWNI